MTRTVHVGRVSRLERAWYEAVLEAQLAGIAAVRPGVTAGEVDEAARSVLRKAKLDRYFTHSTGHGVGLEIHEPPRLGKAQTERLEPGMVITIEPGIYVPEKGGIRIEDMVVVTGGGAEVLTPVTKELDRSLKRSQRGIACFERARLHRRVVARLRIGTAGLQPACMR